MLSLRLSGPVASDSVKQMTPCKKVSNLEYDDA